MEATIEETSATPQLPELRRVVLGIAGLGALGVAGAIGAHGIHAAAVPGGLWTAVGAVTLTGPALLVVHQFMGLAAAPDRVVGALAQAVARGGALALGLVPFQLFFSATTQRGPGILALLLCGIGAAGLLSAGRDLVDAERAAGADLPGLIRARFLATSWALLTVLVGVRLGWEVLA